MKRLALLLALIFGAGLTTVQAATHGAHSRAARLKPMTVQAEVVSADATAKTLTVKVNGEEMTHPVRGKAASRLSSLKPGENVTVTIMENDKGEHQYIRSIRTGKAASKKAASSHHASRKY
jgi:ribosomal protein S1